jgi:hypothetical protein
VPPGALTLCREPLNATTRSTAILDSVCVRSALRAPSASGLRWVIRLRPVCVVRFRLCPVCVARSVCVRSALRDPSVSGLGCAIRLRPVCVARSVCVGSGLRP